MIRSSQRPALTVLRNDHPTCTGLADRGLDALLRQAFTALGECRDAITDTGREVPAELTDNLKSLSDEMRQAALLLAVLALEPNPGTPQTRTRHLQVAGKRPGEGCSPPRPSGT